MAVCENLFTQTALAFMCLVCQERAESDVSARDSRTFALKAQLPEFLVTEQ